MKDWKQELEFDQYVHNHSCECRKYDVGAIKKKYWPSEDDLSCEAYCLRGRIVELECVQTMDWQVRYMERIESGLENYLAACWAESTNSLIKLVNAYYGSAIKAGYNEGYFWLGKFYTDLASHCKILSEGIEDQHDVEWRLKKEASERYSYVSSYYDWLACDNLNIALFRNEPHALFWFATRLTEKSWSKCLYRPDSVCGDLLKRAAEQGYPSAMSAYYRYLEHRCAHEAEQFRRWALNFAYMDNSWFAKYISTSSHDEDYDYEPASAEELGQAYPTEGY